MPSDRQSNFLCWFLLGNHTPQDSKALEGNCDSFFRVYILDAENILAKKCKSRYLAFDLFVVVLYLYLYLYLHHFFA